ncbi:hypothetical protein [Dongshaea marina]|uniref:hypothetical protein n=1 Tax=Dongshaea marina TaxID=2047966 RepID=UPI000D3EDB89|nr:hypothetical protein [Dongshaea marina]
MRPAITLSATLLIITLCILAPIFIHAYSDSVSFSLESFFEASWPFILIEFISLGLTGIFLYLFFSGF